MLMMARTTIIVAAVTCLISVVLLDFGEASADEDSSLFSHWTSFKVKYGKQYSSPAEEAKRLKLMIENKRRIDRFNEEQSKRAGYRLALNHMSDWTQDEIDQLLGFKLSHEQRLKLHSSNRKLSDTMRRILESNSSLPDSVDWRHSGRVSSVKDQGKSCGSCWAFSTAGLLEGQELPAKSIKEAISLSAQNIMDCGHFSMQPCAGGNSYQALDDIAVEGGVEAEKDYPYLGTDGDCSYNKSLAVIVNEGGDVIPAGDEELLKKFVANYGPISVSINVVKDGSFDSYKSGVYSSSICRSDMDNLNHAVLLVGYGNDALEGDYWIIKNSWGTSWGEEGFAKMARNRGNMCGIAEFAVIALF